MHPVFKRLAKAAILHRPAPGAAGRGRGLAPVLRYHSIDASGSGHSTTTAQLRMQLDVLAARGYRGCSLAALVEAPDDQTPRVGLSFDDGMRNQAEIAVPELERHGFSATFFVAPEFAGDRARWLLDDFDRLLSAGVERIDEPVDRFLAVARLDRAFVAGRLPHFERVSEDVSLREIHRLNAVASLPVMTWAELAGVARAGMEIGAHVLDHGPLDERAGAPVSDAELAHLVAGARSAIERKLGIDVETFCHPYGPIDPRADAAVRAAGYRYACGEQRGYLDRAAAPGVEGYAIRRLDMERVFTPLELEFLIHPKNRRLLARSWR